MTRWLSADEQRAWRAFRRMVLLVDSRVSRDLQRDSGLSMPDYQVLSTLSESAERRRRLTELAARMQWSPSRLSHHVTRMQQRGLVERVESTEDLRAAYVVLTDEGWNALRLAAPNHVASVRAALMDALDPDDLDAMTRVGEKVARQFGEACLDRGDLDDQSDCADAVGDCPSEAESPAPAHPTSKVAPVSRS